MHVRRLDHAEGDALVAFVARAAERGELTASSPWLEHGLKLSMIDPLHVAVAVDEAGIVGIALPDFKAVIVEPVRRMQGIGSRLVTAGLAIERERGHGALYLGVLPGDARGEAFLRANGLAFHSTVWDLELSPGTPAAVPVLPEGYAARPFNRATDLEEWIGVFNLAFADHPTPLQLDPVGVSRWMDEPDARDDDTVLLEGPDGRIAAFAATDPRYRPDGSLVSRAEVWGLGVRPDLQGRGLGRVALRLGVGWLRALGVETVALSVSGRNDRAIALYESEGFVRTATRDRWSRATDPADEPPYIAPQGAEA